MFKHIGRMSVVSALLLATVFGQLSLTADAGAFRAQAWWGDWFPFFSESTSPEAVPLETTSTDLVDVSESFSGSSAQSGYCGDGITNWELGEQCDDYNTNDGDGCTSSCQSEYCGDGMCNNGENTWGCMSDCPAVCGNWTTEGSETCDDGNTNDGDGCTSSCQSEYCGDGICNNSETASWCSNDCPAICGNWTTEGAETCDDGNTNDGDGCTSSCQSEYCGDGTCNNGENAASCMSDCPSVCGNWTTEGSETCDDGNVNDNDGCSANCAVEYCGDTIQQAGEECDDGNTDSTDACAECKLATCGDGHTYYGYEECDDGAGNSDTQPNACRTSCKRATCGDGVQDDQEACDDGNLTNDDGCSWLCTKEDIYCGDGKVQGAEQCDPGTKCSITGVDCRPGVVACPGGDEDVCEFPKNSGCDYGCSFVCGNGVIDEGETCDSGSACAGTGVDCSTVENRPCADGSACVPRSNQTECYECQKVQHYAAPTSSAFSQSSANYSRSNSSGRSSYGLSISSARTAYGNQTSDPFLSVCGNRIKETGEECDDGNTKDGDGCSYVCKLECGDRTIQFNEECDDGNSDNSDGCTNACRNAACGDTFVRVGVEECDPGPHGDSAECNRDCTYARCGDKKVNRSAGEQCDTGTPNERCSAECLLLKETKCCTCYYVKDNDFCEMQATREKCVRRQCDDGIDNDGDGWTDWSDLDCTSLEDANEGKESYQNPCLWGVIDWIDGEPMCADAQEVQCEYNVANRQEYKDCDYTRILQGERGESIPYDVSYACTNIQDEYLEHASDDPAFAKKAFDSARVCVECNSALCFTILDRGCSIFDNYSTAQEYANQLQNELKTYDISSVVISGNQNVTTATVSEDGNISRWPPASVVFTVKETGVETAFDDCRFGQPCSVSNFDKSSLCTDQDSKLVSAICCRAITSHDLLGNTGIMQRGKSCNTISSFSASEFGVAEICEDAFKKAEALQMTKNWPLAKKDCDAQGGYLYRQCSTYPGDQQYTLGIFGSYCDVQMNCVFRCLATNNPALY